MHPSSNNSTPAQNDTQPPPAAATARKRAIVVVFARLPVAGKVKTRLAAGIGPEQAAAFYKLCAEHACHEVLRCPAADGVVFCASAEDVQGVSSWLAGAGAALPVRPQVQDTDLGRRMIDALTAAATTDAAGGSLDVPATDQPQQHGYEAAIVIGTDIPDVSSEVLSAAVAALLGDAAGTTGQRAASAVSAQGGGQQPPGADMLLGPAADGGYYLLGFRTEALLRREVQDCSVFEGVQWSSASVLQDTLAAAARIPGLRSAPVSTLPTLQDIDTVQDVAAWLGASQAGSGVGASANEGAQEAVACGSSSASGAAAARLKASMRELLLSCTAQPT